MRVGDVRPAAEQEAGDAGDDAGPVGAADQQPGVAHHSLRLNSTIAIASITPPSAATTAASSMLGTRQPNQVTPGSSRARVAAGMSRWLKTRRRIGSTAYVMGSRRLRISSQRGSPDTGN